MRTILHVCMHCTSILVTDYYCQLLFKFEIIIVIITDREAKLVDPCKHACLYKPTNIYDK